MIRTVCLAATALLMLSACAKSEESRLASSCTAAANVLDPSGASVSNAEETCACVSTKLAASFSEEESGALIKALDLMTDSNGEKGDEAMTELVTNHPSVMEQFSIATAECNLGL